MPFFEVSRAPLDRLLHALDQQDYPADLVRIVLVDNNEARVGFLPRPGCASVTLVHAPEPIGSYAARNAGLGLAHSDLVLFTDADCLPHPQWISEMVRALVGSPCCVVAGGSISVTSRDPHRPHVVEDFDRRMHLRQGDYLSRGFAATANLGTCSAVFAHVGSFAAGLLSGGDEEWCERTRAAGVPVIPVTSALVRHPARRTLSSVVTKNRRGCGSPFQKWARAPGPTVAACFGAELLRVRSRWRRLWVDRHPTRPARWCGLVALFVLVEIVRLAECARLAAGGTPERR
ncbi:glycosyltransferase family 2 protein [Streptomyces sp. PLK6-54]|uniref:Glycosyltransferase family 2 protein n=1 Tax=Actinacidiphila acidipaludis TaxID=2873382 RepID=A0ABS7Q3E8_9ACTN|nr:glycosyltransferase family 2 protein [Streptomyces acidipaludis]